jgi:hypothetical protein
MYGGAMQPVQICKLVSMTVNVVLLFNEHQRYFFFAQTILCCLIAHFCKVIAHRVASHFAT